MESTSWGGSYRPGADAHWADATMWIEDGDLGIGLTGSWTIVPAVALTDVVAVAAVGEDARGTELKITLLAGHTFSLAAPKGFVDEFIGALQHSTVLDLTEPASHAAPSPTELQPAVAVARAPEADGIRCGECGVLCLTLADLRDHELVHQPRVEFVPFPSA